MIIGLGTDLVDVPRIAKSVAAYGDRFLKRVFTPGEREYASGKANSNERYAARFAAKEAAMKALGTGWSGGLTWTQIEVTNNPHGVPQLQFYGEAAAIAERLGVRRRWISLTHTAELAEAVVILED